jgi:arginine exporter protein ArgO
MKKTITYSIIYFVGLACLSWLIYEDLKSDNIRSLIISSVSIIIGTIAYIQLMMKCRKC